MGQMPFLLPNSTVSTQCTGNAQNATALTNNTSFVQFHLADFVAS